MGYRTNFEIFHDNSKVDADGFCGIFITFHAYCVLGHTVLLCGEYNIG